MLLFIFFYSIISILQILLSNFFYITYSFIHIRHLKCNIKKRFMKSICQYMVTAHLFLFFRLVFNFMKCNINMLDFLVIRYGLFKLNKSFIIFKQDWDKFFYSIYIICSKVLKVDNNLSFANCYFCRYK